MEKRKVKYDIIGASFYPFYHGKLSALQDNLNTISERFKKPVFVAETSYAYTLTPHDHAANIFGPNQEESGGYLATIQGQATAIRDIIEVVANVPKNRGLGICYWNRRGSPCAGPAGRKRGRRPPGATKPSSPIWRMCASFSEGFQGRAGEEAGSS